MFAKTSMNVTEQTLEGTDYMVPELIRRSVLVVSGLISPGVSVPVQVPGSEADMSQYWPRLQ